MQFIDLIRAVHHKRLLIGGHRGHQSATRENTIPNFAEVRQNGIAYIEIDVQLSKDDQAVIFHDSDLSERTPLTGSIRDYTVEQLKASFELCTLDEAIAWCKEQGMYVLLEIKSKNYDDVTERPALAKQIVDAISKYQFQDYCIPFSIDYRILRLIKQALPEITLAIIVGAPPGNPIRLMKDTQATIYLSYLTDMDQALVDTLHQAGYFVDGSIVNTQEALERAYALGVDMVESDYPEKMIALTKTIKGEDS